MQDSEDARGRPARRPLSSWALPAGLVLLALIVRVLVVGLDSSYEPQQDSLDYDRHARSIAAGDGFPDSVYVPDGGPSALRAPAYPYALGAVYAMSGDSVTVGRLFGACLGALSVLLLFLLATRIWSRRVGLVVALAASVYPPLVGLSSELYSEVLFVFLILGAALVVLRFRESGMLRWAVAAGVLGGLAALTRGPGVIALLPLAFGLWMLRPRLSVRALGPPALALLCSIVVIAPWTLRNAVEFGRLIPITTSSGFGLAGTYNETSLADEFAPAAWRTPVIVPDLTPLFQASGVDEATLDSTLAEEATSIMGAHPGYVVKASIHNLLRMSYLEGDSVVDYGAEVVAPGIGNRGTGADRISFAILAFFALAGLVAILSARRPQGPSSGRMSPMITAGPAYIWLVPLALVIVAAPVAGLPRYRVPADPFLLILAAIGAVWLFDRLRSRGTLRTSSAALGILLVALVAAGCGGSSKSDEPTTSNVATSPTETTTPDPNAPSRAAYIESADRICRRALADGQQIAAQASEAPAGDVLALTTEKLIKPGLAVREQQADDLRELTRPAGANKALDDYLGLFDPIAEILRLRLAAGRAADNTEATHYESLLAPLALDQRRAAQAYGFEDCSKDVIGAAFK